MNDTIKTIFDLRSVRDFSSKEVSDEDLKTIINACIRTANASNRQSYSIVVVESRKDIKEYINYPGSKALIFCVDFNRIVDAAEYLRQPYFVHDIQDFITGTVDAVLAAQTAAIAAKSLGMDSLFTNSIHRGNMPKLYKQFELPEKYCFPLISLVLGYTEQEPGFTRGRLNGDGIVHYGKYKRLSKEGLESVISEYDDADKHIGSFNSWKEEGFTHYLDWFYAKWCPMFGEKDSKAYLDKLHEYYSLLSSGGFISGPGKQKP